jgi:hypothetical protein
VAVIGHAPAPVPYLGETLGLAQYGFVAAQRLLGLLVLPVVLDDGDEVVGREAELWRSLQTVI